MTLLSANLLGSPVAATDMTSMVEYVGALAQSQRPSYVCFATAHMMVLATQDRNIRSAYQNATAIAPDGAPVAWFARLLSGRDAECVSGPRFTMQFFQYAEQNGIRVGFYGGRTETLERMRARIATEFPALQVAYMYSPPFRKLSAEEHEQDLQQIRDSGTQVLFVGLGSPKQECWMRDASPKLPCVALGVGAAFEFFAGEKTLPPEWVQKLALTWAVRLAQEPRRLFVRNLYSPVFLVQGMRWLSMSQNRRARWQQKIVQRLSPDLATEGNVAT